ncbi:hypothetical protein MN2019_11935 [Mycolicibacterium neoaurum]|uniref:hypothetical protein n=1 Tax=Mycolicibacterium neoaurum TaxID=1795 RepID=UPI001BCAE2EE|nr:hypothetical protein [Mycolicibacterium neoaurum]QVI29932.1 hypothetical protein MN2019_11935 [Mycolicibacterium neoaurum]
MTGTVTPPGTERAAAGTLEGYRWWLVENGRLVSPFASIVLPANGIAFDTSFYATRDDLDEAAAYLDRRATALTIGTVTRVHPDPEPQTYDIGGRKVQLPAAYIANTYTVQTIITNASGLLYRLPVLRWG